MHGNLDYATLAHIGQTFGQARRGGPPAMRKPTNSVSRAPIWIVVICVLLVTGALWALITYLAFEAIGLLGRWAA